MATTPYRALAPFYNAVMAHVDYPHWARHVRALWRAHRGAAPPERVLELAAGTCPFAAPALFPTAFTVHTDRSPDMLRQGSASARRVACDATAPPFRNGEFDLVLMMYDSLNYLLTEEGVARVFERARDALRPGGLFILDVTTATCSRRHFADALDFQELDGGTAVRASRYDAATRMQLNLFTFFVAGADGRYDRREEVHRQRIYPVAALTRLAKMCGFAVRGRLADFTLDPGSDRNERIHFVLQKP